jgi:hypothetical protein
MSINFIIFLFFHFIYYIITFYLAYFLISLNFTTVIYTKNLQITILCLFLFFT